MPGHQNKPVDRARRAFITRAKLVSAKKRGLVPDTRRNGIKPRGAQRSRYPGTIFHNLAMKNGRRDTRRAVPRVLSRLI